MWWLERTAIPAFAVDDVHFVQPCGFVWWSKPRYRVKCGRRVYNAAVD